jgi:hypothetical protein
MSSSYMHQLKMDGLGCLSVRDLNVPGQCQTNPGLMPD